MPLTIGQAAPHFELYNSDNKLVSLSDFSGRPVVLLFFPFAFSGVCTKELCSVRDHIADYNNVNAEVLGISVDGIHSLDRFKEDQKLNFTLLSDFNKVVSTEYDAIHEVFSRGDKGVSKRSVFVIDAKGILRHSEVLDNPGQIPDLEKVTELLKTI